MQGESLRNIYVFIIGFVLADLFFLIFLSWGRPIGLVDATKRTAHLDFGNFVERKDWVSCVCCFVIAVVKRVCVRERASVVSYQHTAV